MTLYPYIYIIQIDVAVQVFACFFLSGNLTKICLGLGAASIYMVIDSFIIVRFWQTYQKCCKFNQQQLVLLISTNPTVDIKTWNSGTLWKVWFKKIQSTAVQTVEKVFWNTSSCHMDPQLLVPCHVMVTSYPQVPLYDQFDIVE